MQNWQVLILSGPIGSGKASVGQQLAGKLPDTAYMQVYRSKTGQLGLPGGDAAREQAIADARAHLARGQRVVIDDVIESPQELNGYLTELRDAPALAVTLMPSLEEMERRDSFKPLELQAGSRVNEVYKAMAERLGRHSSVLDTTNETVEDTVARVLAILEK